MLFFCSLPEQWKHSSIQSPLQTSHLSNPGALFFLSDAGAALLVVFTFLLRIKHCLLWYAKHRAKLKEHTRRRGAREGLKETFAPNEEPRAVGVNFLQSWWASIEFDLFLVQLNLSLCLLKSLIVRIVDLKIFSVPNGIQFPLFSSENYVFFLGEKVF